MTWTEPTTRQTGDLITAEIWNTDVVDNLQLLHDSNFGAVYDSGWFAVTHGTAYQKTHGLGNTPRLIVVLWGSSASPADWHSVTAVVHDGSTRGLAIYPTATSVRVSTGNSASQGTLYTPMVGSGGGYYRILAWE